MDKQIKKYLKRVSANLDCGFRTKRSLLKGLESELEDRLEGQTYSSYEELTQLLGKPESLALELTESGVIKTQMNPARRKQIFLTVIAVLAVAVIVFAVLFLMGLEVHSGYYDVTLTTY